MTIIGQSFYFLPALVFSKQVKPASFGLFLANGSCPTRNPCSLLQHSGLWAVNAIPTPSSCLNRLAEMTTELMQVILEANALRDKFSACTLCTAHFVIPEILSPEYLAYNQISARLACWTRSETYLGILGQMYRFVGNPVVRYSFKADGFALCIFSLGRPFYGAIMSGEKEIQSSQLSWGGV